MKWHKRFFWLLLVFLPTQLGYHFWPDWATVLGRRVDYLAPTVYLTDILLLLTVVTFIISNFKFLISKQIPIILLGILFAAVNVFVAENQMVALYKWIKMAEFVMLGWYIVRTRPSFSLIAFPLSLGILYSSVIAIVQFVLQSSVGGALWWLGERTFTVDTPGIARFDFNFSLLASRFSLFGLRPYATFPHPNVLAGFLAAVLPLLLMSLMGPMGQMRKGMYVASLVVGVVALLLTFSRSAIVVGGVAIAVALLFRHSRPVTKYGVNSSGNPVFLLRWILGACPRPDRGSSPRMTEKVVRVLFFLGVILGSWFLVQSVQTQSESVVVRGQLNAAAIKLWQTSPLFGVGLGNFLVRLPEVLPTRTIYFLQPVHNIYLLVLAETGIVGLIFFLWFMWLAMSREWRMENGEWKRKPEFTSILYSLFSILLLGLVDHYPLTLQQGQLLLTVLAGMSIALLSLY